MGERAEGVEGPTPIGRGTVVGRDRTGPRVRWIGLCEVHIAIVMITCENKNAKSITEHHGTAQQLEGITIANKHSTHSAYSRKRNNSQQEALRNFSVSMQIGKSKQVTRAPLQC